MPQGTGLPPKVLLASVALAVLFAVSIIYRARDTADRIAEVRHGATLAKLPFNVDLPQFEVSGPEPEAREAGLRTGDAIVSVGDRPLRRLSDLFGPLRNMRAGERFTIQVESDEETRAGRRAASIVLRPMRAGPPTSYDWLMGAVYIVMPYLCMALGFWVAAVRIRHPQAWLLLALLLSLAEFAGSNWRTLFGRGDPFQPIAMAYQNVLANLWPTTMMLFGIYFPDRLELDRRYPWAKWIVIGPILLRVVGATLILQLAVVGNIPAAIRLERYIGWTTPVVALHLVALLVFFVAMGYKTVTASTPDARRRLLLLDAGAAVGITPLIVYLILNVAGIVEFRVWVFLVLVALLFLFPVAMAYVIVVHRAMDVRVVVRQGLQYLLARGSLRALQVALSVLVVAAAATMSAAATALNRVLLVAGGLAAVLLIQTYADRLRRWVDRRFFREAYAAEQILSDLANKVRTMVETGPLLETVARRVSETLHVPRVAILLNGGGTLQPAYALGHSLVPAVAIPQDSLTRDAERQLQEALGSELLLPLSSNQKLLGVMSLGPKQSEEPFSGSDLRLLDAVAGQTGLALENSRLTAEIATEAAGRERAKRELEIAREVQERLFPQEYPPIAGIDYAGACRPALGIGGDYYDFIQISDTQLGVAIGDVSGKGIPAALLMATLRAYLRSQTIRGFSRGASTVESDVAAMMSTLNALVYESSASNRYATFFYGQYNPATRVLHYVNGGHNPPLLFRQSGREVVRLDAGGPVIGLIEDCCYVQGRTTLEPGDVLVAFTDGVTEAMNAADEEWGEEKLIEAVWPHRGLPARDLIERLMRDADGFVAGAKQHDDMTLVVVRLT